MAIAILFAVDAKVKKATIKKALAKLFALHVNAFKDKNCLYQCLKHLGVNNLLL